MLSGLERASPAGSQMAPKYQQKRLASVSLVRAVETRRWDTGALSQE
jgi:hypothetical protein